MGIDTQVRWELIRQSPLKKLNLLDSFCEDVIILRISPGMNKSIEQSLQPPIKGAQSGTPPSLQLPCTFKLIDFPFPYGGVV